MICGDRDPFVPVDHAQGLRRQLPDGRLLVVPDCGHEVMSRKPSLFNEALAGFFRATATVAAARAAAYEASVHGGQRAPARTPASHPLAPVNPLAEAPADDTGTDRDWIVNLTR